MTRTEGRRRRAPDSFCRQTMNLAVLNKVCFALAVASIAVGVALGLVMVWTPGVDETLWRLVATVGLVFLGAFATLSVSRTYAEPCRREVDSTAGGSADAGSDAA